MRTEQIVKLQKEVTRLKNENKHYRIEKEASLLSNKLINSYAEELEEDNKNLQVLSSINGKEHMRIHEQNKRYREALNEIKQDIQGDYTEKELSDYPLLEVIVEQINKVMERDTDDRTVESPHSSWF